MKPLVSLTSASTEISLPEREMQEAGVTYFSYGLLSHGDLILSYFTNEEWGHRYQEKRYGQIDPLMRGVVQSRFPLILWEALHPCGKEKQIMAERNEICQLKSGLTFGINSKHYTEIIAFGTEVPPQEFYTLLRDQAYVRKLYDILSHFYRAHEGNFPLVH